jgi:NMD protein affecting ribosome stability and mRNA decay
MHRDSPYPVMKCIKCGEEFERREDHPGKANVCRTCYLTWKEPPSIVLPNGDEYEIVE